MQFLSKRCLQARVFQHNRQQIMTIMMLLALFFTRRMEMISGQQAASQDQNTGRTGQIINCLCGLMNRQMRSPEPRYLATPIIARIKCLLSGCSLIRTYLRKTQEEMPLCHLLEAAADLAGKSLKAAIR